MLQKNLLFVVLFVLISFVGQAQITLENEYNADISPALLESVGTKYVFYDRANDQVKLYNMDHSIYKTITIAVNSLYNTSVYSDNGYSNVYYIKEGLFDTDSEIEFMFYYSTEDSGGNNYVNGTAIVNEDGTIIFDRKTVFPYGYYNISFGKSKGIQAIIKGSNNATKMVLASGFPTDSTLIYNLPGTLMCDPCGGTTGARSTERTEKIVLDQNIPNPSSTYTVIGYQLPEESRTGTLKIYNTTGIELKSYEIDKTFDHLQVSTEDLPAGTYFYTVETNDGHLQSKKMIVVK